MRIKELHLRNIASIEKADIDFEKGLNDIVTGAPANIFLISGDTGAGKSVILDGISMALYKKTPRIEGVSNKKNNDYINSEGESVGINSLEQYTRLGISEKDECYSEVVFVGNDRKEYRARLSLGVSLGIKDKITGKRPIKHRAPKWEVKNENSDWQRVEANTGQPILDAVGLSFEQFGRMAMLAQGQFASFLTGDKKERESILERLTNTEHFSSYGIAINRLFKKAEARKNQDEIELNANKNYLLSEDEVRNLNADLVECETNKLELKKQSDANMDKLKLLSAIESHRKEMSDAEKEKEFYKSKMSSEEYINKKALVDDWDATIEQRKMLADLNNAKAKQKSAAFEISRLREKFNLLSSDLLAEHNDYNLKSIDVEGQKEWIESQCDNADLYGKSGEVDVKLDNFATEISNKAKADAEAARLQGLMQGLLDDVTKKSEDDKAAGNRLKEKQDDIDSLIRERVALKPLEINEKMNLAVTRSHDLDSLRKDIEALEKSEGVVKGLSVDIGKKEINLKLLLDAKEEAERNLQGRKSAYDEAQRRLNTMKMSVKDVIVNLRKQLYDGKVETCPLCGQHITEFHIDEDFEKLVTPLQEEQNKAAELLNEAEKQANKAIENYTEGVGLLLGMRTELERLTGEVNKNRIGVNKKAVDLGLNLDDSLLVQVETEMNNLSVQIERLKELQTKAEALQEKINRLTNDKKTLETEFANAEKAMRAAIKAHDDNCNGILIQNQLSGAAEAKINVLVNELHVLLAAAYPDWEKDVEQVRSNLRQRAKEYNDNKQKYDADCLALGRLGDKLGKLENLKESILEFDATWKSDCEAARYACSDIEVEWTKLFADCRTKRAEKKAAEEIICEKSPKLDDYYRETGKTEDLLAQIESKQYELAADRKYVSDIEEKYKSSLEVIHRALEAIGDNMKKLGAKSEEDIPHKDALEFEKNDLSLKLQELDNKIGAIKSKLHDNAANKDKLQALEKKLEMSVGVYDKWYRINSIFGGTRFRTLVQTYILRPLLDNANIYLSLITDRYTLTCSEDNEQLSILVLDKYNKNQVRSVTVLSGGERFMVSLALSLALSSLNRPDINVNILFIDEGFGTLDEKNLDSVMSTLEKLQEIAGQSERRVGIISHREELDERIPVQIRVEKKGEGRSFVNILGVK